MINTNWQSKISWCSLSWSFTVVKTINVTTNRPFTFLVNLEAKHLSRFWHIPFSTPTYCMGFSCEANQLKLAKTKILFKEQQDFVSQVYKELKIPKVPDFLYLSSCIFMWWWRWIVFAFSLISSWDHCQRSSPSHWESATHASRIWTCAEPEFRLCWMKLCSSDNTTPWRQI